MSKTKQTKPKDPKETKESQRKPNTVLETAKLNCTKTKNKKRQQPNFEAATKNQRPKIAKPKLHNQKQPGGKQRA